jgi:RNA polymerase sigma factor (sigma-70 family)
MTSRPRDAVSLKGLETLFQVGAVGNLSDGQLLDGFVAARGAGEVAEATFTALVDRHGPMVLRVCRQILGDTHDAQDAFQATFLILVRKAGSVRKRDSVASWLHGIARRVSQRARSDRIRRRDYERRSAEMATRTEVQDADEPESWPEIHEELARLPGKYRESVVLCYLEGLTTEEAARRLGCPQGTILSRLSRARERLRERLTRRGLMVPAGLLADIPQAVTVPSALSQSVIQSALQLAAGGAVTTVVPASVADLTQGILRIMTMTKLKITAAALTMVAALAVGAGAILQEVSAGRPQTTQPKGESRAAPSVLVANIGNIRGLFAPGLIPADLKWIDVPSEQRVRILDLIEERTRTNLERIRTWKGTYSYKLGQLLSGPHLPIAFKDGIPMQNLAALMLEFDGRVDFAIDMENGATYRDKRTTAMTFIKPDTREVVDVRGPAAWDFRSIVTNKQIIIFPPDEQVTYGYLQHLPEARNKRLARRYDRTASNPRARDVIEQHLGSHYGEVLDPRAFFSTDAGKPTWSLLERLAGALRADHDNKIRRALEDHFSLAQADGPDGRWYCHQQWFGTGNGSSMWYTAFWKPGAGYNPVGYVVTFDRPDGKVSTKAEWEWTVIDGVHVPSRIKEVGYENPNGTPSRERESSLSHCVLNRALDPHQFDYAGLAMADGDLVIDEAKRVGYIIRAGEPVKLGDFVDPDDQ